LEIRPDPRISVDQAAFDAQFRLAKQVEQSRALAHTILKDAATIKDKLAAKKGNSAAQAALAQVNAVVGAPPPVLGTSNASTLLGISDRLDDLYNGIEGSDGAPSPDQLHGYALLEQGLQAAAKRWAAIGPTAKAEAGIQ
jgi:hypothetical protein